jgi:hypothetical protein
MPAPLWFKLLEGFPFRVVANDMSVDKGTYIELFRPEHRHFDRVEAIVCW